MSVDIIGWFDCLSRDDVMGVCNGFFKCWGVFCVNNFIGGWDEMKIIFVVIENE